MRTEISIARDNIKRIAIVVLLILLCILCACCTPRERKLITTSDVDRKELPALTADDVRTIISDSGITKYLMEAPKWMIYDKADSPYWEFPNGLYIEQFNSNLEAEATVEADYARYNETAQRWLLRGNVKAINLEGEQFETPLLYWDQKSETIYSDSSIVITRQESVLKGIGFRSNQSMTKYTILRPTGIFPIKE